MSRISCDRFSPLITNWRGGCAGVTVFLIVWAALFFIAFMIAFGNETPVNRAILHVMGPVLDLTNPLWGVFGAYLAGTYLFKKDPCA